MTPLLSRLSALGLTLAVPALLILGVILPGWGHHTALSDEARRLNERIDLLTERAREQGRFSPTVVTDTATLRTASEASAAARLQDRLDIAAARAGGEIRSVRVEPTVPLPDLDVARKVPITLELLIDTRGLQELLHDLETAAPYLFIERLSVRSRRTGGADDAALLDATFRVVVIYEPPEAE